MQHFAPRVGVERACRAFAINPRTYRHRRQAREDRLPPRDRSAGKPRAPHPAALTIQEKERILQELCSPRFCDQAPAQVFFALLDEGVYLCSIRQMYRLLEDHGLLCERRRGGHQRHGLYPIPMLEATAPKQCWSWDITRVPGPHKGVFYFLYTLLDIFSRQVVGWTIATRESESVARELLAKTCEREGIDPGQLTVHADRGAPMISGSLAELLLDLGVIKSHSRPRVSNDNAYIEAHFKTLKYHRNYPQRFASIQAARAWCRAFFEYYNCEHYHSGIGYYRPADVHAGRHHEVIEQRQEVLDQAQAEHPARFARRPRPAKPPSRAWINRPSVQTQ